MEISLKFQTSIIPESSFVWSSLMKPLSAEQNAIIRYTHSNTHKHKTQPHGPHVSHCFERIRKIVIVNNSWGIIDILMNLFPYTVEVGIGYIPSQYKLYEHRPNDEQTNCTMNYYFRNLGEQFACKLLVFKRANENENKEPANFNSSQCIRGCILLAKLPHEMHGSICIRNLLLWNLNEVRLYGNSALAHYAFEQWDSVQALDCGSDFLSFRLIKLCPTNFHLFK